MRNLNGIKDNLNADYISQVFQIDGIITGKKVLGRLQKKSSRSLDWKGLLRNSS